MLDVDHHRPDRLAVCFDFDRFCEDEHGRPRFSCVPVISVPDVRAWREVCPATMKGKLFYPGGDRVDGDEAAQTLDRHIVKCPSVGQPSTERTLPGRYRAPPEWLSAGRPTPGKR